MSITKSTTLKSVNVNLEANILEVLWVTEIKEDGVVLTSSNQRSSYGANEKERFTSDLGDDAARNMPLFTVIETNAGVVNEGVVVPFSITPRQIRLQLSNLGMRQAVEDFVAGRSLEIKDWWEFSLSFERNSPLLIESATQLGLSAEQVDELFIEAAKL